MYTRTHTSLLARIGGLTVAMSILCRAAFSQTASQHSVPYELIGMFAYKNFLENWDSAKYPMLFADIRSSSQYDAWFEHIAITGDRRPFGPDQKVYGAKQIFLIGTVTDAPKNDPEYKLLSKFLTVEQVTEENHQLTIRYRKHSFPSTNVGFGMRFSLSIMVPKTSYRTVTFFEDGKKVATLNLAGGQWSRPTPPMKK